MAVLLAQWEKIKKDKHGKQFHILWKYFSSFVLYVGDMIGREALVIIPNFSQLMAAKMDEPILHV